MNSFPDDALEFRDKPGLISYELLRSRPAAEWFDEAANGRPPGRLLGDLWLEGELCVLFGDTGKGKSVFATQIADAIARGACVGPFTNQTPPQKVLYFDFEMTTAQFAARYTADQILDSTNSPTAKIRDPHSAFRNFFTFSPNLIRVEMASGPPDHEGYGFKNFRSYFATAVVDQIEQHEAKVVVIDNITYLSDQLQSSARAAHVMKELRRIKSEHDLSMLVIGHSPKRRPTDRLTTRDLVGSKMQANFADSMVAIGSSLKGANVRYLKQVKSRSAASNHESENVVLFRIEKIGPFLQLTHTGYARETDHIHLISRSVPPTNRQTLTAQALALQSAGQTQRQIAKTLNIPKSTLHTYLKTAPKP
ncbi:MAG: AAA family ATPase [Acidobacteriota bacterium]